jgi:hypothetical protein
MDSVSQETNNLIGAESAAVIAKNLAQRKEIRSPQHQSPNFK